MKILVVVLVKDRDRVVARPDREKRQRENVQFRYPEVIGRHETAHLSRGERALHDVKIVLIQTIFQFDNPDFSRVAVDDGNCP
jgi:hypothetical protein